MSEPRVTTAVRFPPALHERLKRVSRDNVVSVNKLVNVAVERLLDSLTDSPPLLVAPRPDPPPVIIPADYSWRERRRLVRQFKQSIHETH